MINNLYPLFRPLQKSDKPLFDEAFIKNPPEISEFTFTNLYAWREIYNIKFSVLNDALILRSEAREVPEFFPPIGRTNTKHIIEELIKASGGVFIRTPEETKTLFDKDDRFSCELDLDNSDYLFRADELISLKGRKYDGKRNLIKKFRSTYEHQYIKLDGSNVSHCLEFEERWCSIKSCGNIKGLDDERRAIEHIVENFLEFGLIGGAIMVKGQVCAVAIAERLNPDTLVMHVMKADPGMVGLSQAINNEFLVKEAKRFEYVNMEQDLGQQGLRKSKLSYHPVRMVRKYKIRMK